MAVPPGCAEGQQGQGQAEGREPALRVRRAGWDALPGEQHRHAGSGPPTPECQGDLPLELHTSSAGVRTAREASS